MQRFPYVFAFKLRRLANNILPGQSVRHQIHNKGDGDSHPANAGASPMTAGSNVIRSNIRLV